jgi:predicted anti-sigma-YlaC factor YlaD
MDCTAFEQMLDRLLGENLTPEERKAAEEHKLLCPRCRELFEIACGNLDIQPREHKEELTDAILQRTSGSTCGQVEDLLCDFVDGNLELGQEKLLQDHIASCEGCATLAAAVREISLDLSGFAEIEPDSDFVSDVLAATIDRQAVWERLSDSIAGWWRSQIKRPRFAVELAYSGAMLLLLIFAAPGSPLRDVPPQAMRIARTNPVEAVAHLFRDGRAVPEGPVSSAQDIWQQTGRPLTRESNRLLGEASGLWTRLGGGFSLGWDYCREIGRTAWRGDFVETWRLIGEMPSQVVAHWKGDHDSDQEDSTEP